MNPDLIVLTGDMVSGDKYDQKSGYFERHWKQFTDIYKEQKKYYAYAFGNHDTQADLSGEKIQELENSNEYSLFRRDHHSNIDLFSTSNYQIEIKSSLKNHEDETTTLIWILDTKGGSRAGCYDKYINNGNGCLTRPQIKWFKETSENLNKSYDKTINGLAFFHIPIPEYMNIWNSKKAFGTRGEQVDCPSLKTDFFQQAKELNNIKAMFCGHDHNNDYHGEYQDIKLFYGRKTGYGSYGPDYFDRGARVIKLKESLKNGKTDFELSSYIVTFKSDNEEQKPQKKSDEHQQQQQCPS